MPRREFSRGRPPARRRTGWDLGPGQNAVTEITSTSVTILGSGIILLIDGATLVRTRGSFQAYLTAVAGAGQGFHGAIGIGIVNEDAFAVGVSTIMDPITDADFDGWLYHRFFDIHSVTGTLADGVNSVGVETSFEVDSKAMRKVTDGDVLFAAVEMSEDGTAVADVFFDSRMLFKLP